MSQGTDSWKQELDGIIEEMIPSLVQIRRHLHANPEKSGEEFETTQYLAQQAELFGLSPKIAPTKRGLVLDYDRPTTGSSQSQENPRIGIRADIDALALNDLKTVPYRSCRPGVMHGCGHDVHATMALGAAAVLHRIQSRLPWPTPWRTIFQPAEETAVGALEMIEAGAIQGVKQLIALHVDPELPAGWIGARHGVLTARCEEIVVKIQGKGGHGARPFQTIDPIAAAAQFINSVYQFMPRSMDAREPVVVSFCSIKAGSSANVIPHEAELLGTIRTLGPEQAQQVQERLLQIANGVSQSSGAEIQIHFRRSIEAVNNDPAIAQIYNQIAKEIVGPDRVRDILLPSMGAEDFSGYLKQVPGAMFRLGAGRPDQANALLHSPQFDIDERAIPIGVRLLARTTIALAEDLCMC